MRAHYQNLFKAIALTVIICLSNAGIFAAITIEDGISPAALPVMGVLNCADAQTVSVDGNAAQDNMTILSGVELKTGDGSAAVKISGLGEIELGRETSASLTFTGKRVDVVLSGGNARLTAYRAIDGTLTTAGGEVLKTDSALEISVVKSAADQDDAADADASGQASSASNSFLGISMPVWMGILGGTAGTVAIMMGKKDKKPKVSKVKPR